MADHETAWSVTWTDGYMTIELPAQDHRRIKKAAKQAGVTVETFVRQRLGMLLLAEG